MAVDINNRLALYESRPIQPVKVFSPGVYQIRLSTEGNSLLSTVWVKSCSVGASVKVSYYDFGPGSDVFPGERVLLNDHTAISTSDTSDRIIVTNLHNKPRVVMEVTGGDVEFGVYVSVVATFASDLDASLVKHLQDAVITKDKGLVVAGYDEGLDQFFFLPIENGQVKVTGTTSIVDPGTPFYIRGEVNADPGNSITVFSETVAAATTKTLKQLWVTALNDGHFSLEANGLQIAYGRIDNILHNCRFNFDPPRPISTGVVLELKYISDPEPTFACPVVAFLSGYDVI